MAEQSKKGTVDQKIAHTAKRWRQHDREAIADKQDPEKQRAEYFARNDLRKVIDEAGSEP